MDDWKIELKNYREMKICSKCYDLYGFFDYGGKCFYQKSKCQRCKDDPKWVTKSDGSVSGSWRFDFNEAITLCYCCGQEVLSSGSKFSVWFCSDCQELLKEFKSLYRVVIPIGRHSFMAGIMLKGEDIQNNQNALTQFCNSLNALFNRIDVLDRWRTHIMQKNLKILSLTEDVLLFDYLSARDYLPIKERAVKGLVEFFMPYRTEPGDNVSNVKNYLARGWVVECVDDSQSGWLTLKEGKVVYPPRWDTNPCLEKGKLYRIKKCDEGYFVELEGVPERWRADRFKVFTRKLEDLKYEVPVKIKLPYASKLLGEDLYVVITKKGGIVP